MLARPTFWNSKFGMPINPNGAILSEGVMLLLKSVRDGKVPMSLVNINNGKVRKNT